MEKPKPIAAVPSRLFALANCRCPRCREGELFEKPAYRIDAFYKMYPECTHCGQDFVIEPGFYMGASYIGYGFTSLISVIGALGYVFLFPSWNEWAVIALIVGLILVLLPLIFRYASTVMLHGLGSVRFDPGFARRFKLYVGEDGQLHSEKLETAE
jgi:uncharacterized protein (DUF983 family)